MRLAESQWLQKQQPRRGVTLDDDVLKYIFCEIRLDEVGESSNQNLNPDWKSIVVRHVVMKAWCCLLLTTLDKNIRHVVDRVLWYISEMYEDPNLTIGA